MPNLPPNADPAAMPLRAHVEAAAEHLRRGGVAAIPTDTIYGLAANALDEQAVARVFRLKRRPEGMALPLLVADTADLDVWARDVPDEARRLAERFWPGALTLVLRKSPDIPPAATGGLDTVALRVPAHDTPRALARLLGCPVTGTSAKPQRTAGAYGRRRRAPRVRGGVLHGARRPMQRRCPASTLVDLTGSTPRILREGAISRAALSPGLRQHRVPGRVGQSAPPEECS